MHRFLVGILLLVLLAGCIASDDPPEAPDEPAAPTGPLRAEVACADGCWEPMVAVGHDQTVFVTSSEDGLFALVPGSTELEARTLPPQELDGAFRGDEAVHVDSAGRLYWSALTAGELVGPTSSRSVEVHVSNDGGVSWAASNYLGPIDSPTAGTSPTTISADRQWLFFDDDNAYVTFQRPTGAAVVFASEVVMARAPAGTVDFGPWETVSPLETRGGSKISGQGIATDQGQLVPMWTNGPGVAGVWGYWLAHVTPEGVTYTNVDQGNTGSWFPAVARLHDGSYVAAWRTSDGNVMTSWSSDAVTWQQPATVDTQGVTSPWLTPWQDGAALVWHSGSSEETDLMLATGTPSGWSDPVLVQEGIVGQFGRGSNSDMSHVASHGDVLAVTWSSQSPGAMGVVVYRPGDL